MMISRVGGTSLILTREQKTLLESIFWLALGYALGWHRIRSVVCVCTTQYVRPPKADPRVESCSILKNDVLIQ